MATTPAAPAEPVAFDADTLAAEFHADLAAHADTHVEPPAPEPPAGETPRPDAPLPGGDTSQAAPVPSTSTPEGGHPPDATTTVAAADADLTHALDLAGAKDAPEAERLKALATKLISTTQALAALKREGKTAPSEAPPPTAEIPAAPQAQQAVTTPQAPPETPAQAPAEVEAAIEQQATQVEQSDQTYRAYASQYDGTIQRLATIVDRDPSQPNNPEAFVGALPKLDAEIVALDAEIASVSATLNPPESIKALMPPMDPMDAQRLQDSLDRLGLQRDRKETQRHNLTITANNLRRTRDAAADNLRGRAKEIRDHFRGQYDEQRQNEERDRKIETDAQGYQKQFMTSFEAAYAKSGVKASQHDRILRTLKVEAWRNTQVFDDLSPWLETQIKAEAESLNAYHSEQMADYARLKTADASQQAPNGSQSVIPPLPTETGDWQDQLLAHAAAEARSRRPS